MFHEWGNVVRWTAMGVLVVATVPLFGQAPTRKFRRVAHAASCAHCDSPGNGTVSEYDSPVIVFAAAGQSQELLPGIHRADKGQLQRVGNDSIISVWAYRGFHVRMCEHEDDGNGGGACETYGEGDHDLSPELREQVSFVQVWGDVLASNRNSKLQINAWNGARDGAELRLNEDCTAINPDCIWLFDPETNVIMSGRDPGLVISAAESDGAVHGAVLKLRTDCTVHDLDCHWIYKQGMLISMHNPHLAINAWDGAQQGTLLRLHEACEPSNPDCTWIIR